MKLFKWTVPVPGLSPAEKWMHNRRRLAANKRHHFIPDPVDELDWIHGLPTKEKQKLKFFLSIRRLPVIFPILYVLHGALNVYLYSNSWTALIEFADIPYDERKDLSYSAMAYAHKFYNGIIWILIGIIILYHLRICRIVGSLISQLRINQGQSQ